ncbi:MAG TPA: hypothetical protein VLZ77_04780 [Acidimicrobiales bacterium]|nr:hypothetical protein [Acidimicrobiales bacterium]
MLEQATDTAVAHPAVTRLLEAIESGTPVPGGVLADSVLLDATVPSWRFTTRGAGQVGDQLAQWFADPGHFEELERTALPDGEVVRFLLRWSEQGVAHAAHQTHHLEVDEAGRITSDRMFCGGRWDASLLERMGPWSA